MTTPHKALLQQALDALEDAYMHTTDRSDYRTFKAAAEALQAALDAPDPKPVAWIVEFENGEHELHWNDTKEPLVESQMALYTHPAPRQPLTYAEILSMDILGTKDEALRFARSIEAAHGIKP